MKKALNKNRWLIPFLIILLIFFPLFVYKLNTIPTNIMGDESTYINIAYKIIFSNHIVSPLSFQEDTKSAFNFYWTAISIKTFGVQNTVFAMRFGIVIFSILTLFIFYILLKKKTSSFSSLITTILMGSSLWYLSFSRTGLYNISSVFFGLLMLYFLEEALLKKKYKSYIIAGAVAGISFYTYFSGIIYPISAILYLSVIFLKRLTIEKVKYFILFILFMFAVFFPLVVSIVNNFNFFILRPGVVFIFNNSHTNLFAVYLENLIDVFKGLLLIDGSVIGKGIENLRYFPKDTPVVDPVIKTLFFLSLAVIYFSNSRVGFWIITFFVSIFTIGALTIDAPNLARTITVLPIIYFFSGLTIYSIEKFLNSKFKIKFVPVSLIFAFCVIISFNNISSYFNWVKSEELKDVRQPGIEFGEFNKWSNYQINRIKRGKYPINNYDWYNIRESIK